MRFKCIALLSVMMATSTLFGQIQHRPLIPDPPATAAKPSVMILYQCEKDQCMHGMGGLWVLQGDKGLGIWPYGDLADLTVTSHVGDHIVIERMDRPGSSSDHWADPRIHHFHAKYDGWLAGGTFKGTVEYNGVPQAIDHWSADIGKSPVCDDTRCQPSALFVRALGMNLFGAQLWEAAYECFQGGDVRGDSDSTAMLGIMTDKGLGVKADPKVGLSKLIDAAKAGSFIAQSTLAYAYGTGAEPGIDKNPTESAYWGGKAQQTQGLAQAQANNAQMRRAAGQQMAAMALMVVMRSLGGGGSAASGMSDVDRVQQMDRENVDNCHNYGDPVSCGSAGMSTPQ